MKLYTEEQVTKAFKDGYDSIFNSTDEYYEGINQYSNSLTPIQLPSDEEIEKEAFQIPFNNTNEFYDKSFIKGAKWMKEQILQPNL